MAFDFKKEYKDLYQPKTVPSIVTVPPMRFIAVRGAGDPNESEGAYQHALNLLYGVAYTLKMSYKTGHRIDGYFEYAVPPLEGFWFQEGVQKRRPVGPLPHLLGQRAQGRGPHADHALRSHGGDDLCLKGSIALVPKLKKRSFDVFHTHVMPSGWDAGSRSSAWQGPPGGGR